MKTNIKFLVIACAILINMACVKYEDDSSIINSSDSIELTITAVREGYDPNTRTIRISNGDVEWSPLDEISVFYSDSGNGGSRFTSQNTKQAAIAEFRGKIDGISAGGENFTEGKYLYGVYPYSTNTSFKDGITTITLPANQTAVEGTFANGLFPTIARAQGVNLAFYNICGGVKFTVSRDDIKSISFKGNNNERIAGTANIAFNESGKPIVLDDNVADQETEIVVYAPSGGTFKAGKEYFIVAYPTALSSGFTMTFRTSDIKEGVYNHSTAVEIQRSIFGSLTQVDKDITSWNDVVANGGGFNSGIYLGITGFNASMYSYPISELNEENKTGFNSFIDSLNMKKGTVLYYAVEQALSQMQSVKLPADLSTAAIVTFTDGLDQGSFMLNGSHDDNDTYLNSINYRIKNDSIGGQPITAYAIGLRGSDIQDENVTTFTNNLKKLSSSAENATEAKNMAQVNARFREIAEQLSKSNYIQTINLVIPGLATGTKVRFTFDNVESAELSTLYIEGTYNYDTHSLENITSKGLKTGSGSVIKGIVNGIFVTFSFEKVQTDNNKLIDNKFIDEWTYITSNNTWQRNSEFDKEEDSDIVTERSSAVIMLVLDCSSSLADDFIKAQTNAKDFINTLYNSVNNSNDPDKDVDNALYSTTPKDLSLAIWKDGTRYYISKDEYDKANLSNTVIEGITVVSSGESFIISLTNIQSNPLAEPTAKKLYKDIMPTANQGKIISAKWSDINNAIKKFGGTALNSDNYYYTSSTVANNNYNYNYCIHSSGGSLYSTNYRPYIRGVKSTNCDSAIYWRDENDLKLSVLIDGNREFLTKQEYTERQSEIDTIEGVAIIAGGERFAIHLNNAQSNSISSITTANNMYGDILPTIDQALIISAKWSDINDAIANFGGAKLSSDCAYYTSSTDINNNGYYIYCLYGSSGVLYSSSYAPYIRGVTVIN